VGGHRHGRLDTIYSRRIAAYMTLTMRMVMQADLRELKLDMQLFGTRFDVVLIDLPWEECAWRAHWA